MSKSYYKLYLPWGELSLYAQLDVPENASQRVPAARRPLSIPSACACGGNAGAAGRSRAFDLTPGLAEDIARSRILDAIRAEFGDYELWKKRPC